VDGQFARAQPHNGDRASKISSQKPKRIGENPKIFSQFFHEMRTADLSIEQRLGE
jgi:hypothetical protein